MEEILNNVNWVAVAAGTILSFFAAWIWYSPKLFGKGWAEGVKIKMEPDDQPSGAALLFLVLGLFFMAWFIGVLASRDMLLTVILAIVAYILSEYAGGIFMKHSRYARMADAGFWVVSAVIMIGAQAIL